MSDDLEPALDGDANGWRIDVVDRTGEFSAGIERLKEVVGCVLQDEGVTEAGISVAIVDDLEMSRLHVEFLGIDGPTDVLTFPLLGDSLQSWSGPLAARRGAGRRIGGEVVIGGETAARVAGQLGAEASEEVILYLVHGLLHLCGYDDLEEQHRRQMRRREGELLGLLEVAARVDG